MYLDCTARFFFILLHIVLYIFISFSDSVPSDRSDQENELHKHEKLKKREEEEEIKHTQIYCIHHVSVADVKGVNKRI